MSKVHFKLFYWRESVCWTTPWFVDPTHSDFVFKLDKVLYGWKQSPRAWHERLPTFLISNNFVKDKVDTTLFIKHVDSDIRIVQIYIDDIIFGFTNENFVKILNYAWSMSFKCP